ncbi:unnamed protein product [Vicia faba]|uniref:Uncharacterized protein n=1 Tax=Vicia faba TaxID=3906 RepID=A0AAV0ZQF8_VICFA|nr:unnamed protein product [Vicia faba]
MQNPVEESTNGDETPTYVATTTGDSGERLGLLLKFFGLWIKMMMKVEESEAVEYRSSVITAKVSYRKMNLSLRFRKFVITMDGEDYIWIEVVSLSKLNSTSVILELGGLVESEFEALVACNMVAVGNQASISKSGQNN